MLEKYRGPKITTSLIKFLLFNAVATYLLILTFTAHELNQVSFLSNLNNSISLACYYSLVVLKAERLFIFVTYCFVLLYICELIFILTMNTRSAGLLGPPE